MLDIHILRLREVVRLLYSSSYLTANFAFAHANQPRWPQRTASTSTINLVRLSHRRFRAHFRLTHPHSAGCMWNMPANYDDGIFEQCAGDSGEVRGFFSFLIQKNSHTSFSIAHGSLRHLHLLPRRPCHAGRSYGTVILFVQFCEHDRHRASGGDDDSSQCSNNRKSTLFPPFSHP